MKFRSVRDIIGNLEDWWPWHFSGDDDEKEKVDMNLNPVLLVPGIGGSILNAVNKNGRKERIWVRLFEADREFRTKLYSFYNPETGRTDSLDENTTIEVPEDRHGLHSCDILDPDVLLRLDSVYYFHDLIEQMKGWGYQEGSTLFGFGYDFRQSNRLPEHMERLRKKLETIFEASGGKKVDIVSHSMGGLLVKSFLALHHEIFEKYVHSWIAVTAPFEGAPGFIMDSLLTGVEFIKGWQRQLFVAKWSMHQLLIECPSVYELMAWPHFNWSTPPELRLWRKQSEENGKENVLMEAYGPKNHIEIMLAALEENKLPYNGSEIPLPFNMDIVNWAIETKRILQTAKLPEGVKFYNLFGTSFDTPFHACYGSEKTPLANFGQILHTEAEFDCVDGDGTVPCESAMADGLDAEERLGIPGDHRGILMDERFFRVMKHWLKAGDPDPFYNPYTDFVILPAKEFEIEDHKEETISMTGSSLDMDDHTGASQQGVYIATVSTGSGSSGDIRAEAHAHVNIHHKPDHEDQSQFDVSTIGVAEGRDKEETKAALDLVMAAAAEEAKGANTEGRKIVLDKIVRALDKSVVIRSPEELFQACAASTSNLGSAGDRHNSYLWKLQLECETVNLLSCAQKDCFPRRCESTEVLKANSMQGISKDLQHLSAGHRNSTALLGVDGRNPFKWTIHVQYMNLNGRDVHSIVDCWCARHPLLHFQQLQQQQCNQQTLGSNEATNRSNWYALDLE